MKRLTLTASFVLAVALPAGSAQALTHREAVEYGRAYAHVEKAMSTKTAGCKLIGPHATCNGRVTDARIRRSTEVLQRMFAPAPRPVTYNSTGTTSSTYSAPQAVSSEGSYSDVPGVPASFAACVAERESSNGAGSSNIYGIIPASGVDVSGASVESRRKRSARCTPRTAPLRGRVTTAARCRRCSWRR